jgi:23S rRNA pseudouridine1911/1915/1917 synthase
MPSFCHVIDEIPQGLRLDRYIAEHLRLLSRSQIKARALQGSVNGKKVKLSRQVKQGDRLELFWEDEQPALLVPEDIPLNIIYEDERAVVIDKAQGMVVHPGAGNRRGTLANALYHRSLARGGNCRNEGLRPGIVHRLDKDTSGVIIAAYDDEAHAFLAGQFKSRKAKKTYIALVKGGLTAKSGRIETLIARDPGDRRRFTVSGHGKTSLTLYRVAREWPGHSLVLLRPKTGRTHQLRVHLRYLGNPVTGDAVYGFDDPLFPGATLMLHAKKLQITLPGKGGLREFRSPMPIRFKKMISKLNNL